MDDIDKRNVPVLLVTANVGSIFEDPDNLLISWVKQFLTTVVEVEPMFIALHCQEIGGKNYETSMKHVDSFVRMLLASEELKTFPHFKIFLDEDFSSTERFTALGNLYFVHESVDDWTIWDFDDSEFVLATGQDVFTGNIESVSLKEKDKFPKDFFPECKWSRKGFLRTRWNISGTVFDLINIHLFHDASNFTAMESFPSPYTKTRQHALQHTLERIENDHYESVPFFIFGDFNFRLNTGAVIKKLTVDSTPLRIDNKKGLCDKLVYKNSSNNDLLTLEKKVSDLINHEDTFYNTSNHKWLQRYDEEKALFTENLFELEINFPQSYPFTEDSCATTYMKTRCGAPILVNEDSKDAYIGYQMMGADVPMGDHKPIYMYFNLVTSGKRPSYKFNACLDSACSMHENYAAVEPQRHRAHSNPSLLRQTTHEEVRRISSSIPQQTRSPVHPSPEWLTRTQQLLRSMRISNSSKSHTPLQRLSSRLTSHHSSSSEEWYSDLKNITSEINGEVTNESACNISKTKPLMQTDADTSNACCTSSDGAENIDAKFSRQTDNASLSRHSELSFQSKKNHKSCPSCTLL